MAEQEWNTVVINGNNATWRAADFAAQLVKNGVVFKIEDRVMTDGNCEYIIRFSGGF